MCKELDLDINKFMPEDIKGRKHIIGLFENESEQGQEFTYKEFVTLGAKKYAYKDFNDKIHITVSGVPKDGAKALKDLKDFKNDFVFKYEDTGKNMLAYNDDMEHFMLTDYKGITQEVTEKYGCTLIPTTYSLGISEEYFNLISDESSKHAKYIE